MTDTTKKHAHSSPSLLRALPVSDGKITLRAMKHEDAQAYADGSEDVQVKRFAHLPLEKYTAAIMRDLIDSAIADGLRNGNLAILTISDAASDAFMGSLVLFDISAEEAEIGYWVAPQHRGKNISNAAIALALRIAGALELKRLRARTVADNPASVAVLQKAGFKQCGEAQPDLVPSGKTELSIRFMMAL